MKTQAEIRARLRQCEQARQESIERAITRTDGSSVWNFQMARHQQGAIDALEWMLDVRVVADLVERAGLAPEHIAELLQPIPAPPATKAIKRKEPA